MKFIDRLEEAFIAFLIAGATLVIFLAVAHRFLASWSIPVVQDLALAINMSWAQELCIIMFVWMAKFGAAYGVRTGIHVGVDVLINRLTDRNRRRFVLFGTLHQHHLRVRGAIRLGKRRPLCVHERDGSRTGGHVSRPDNP